MNTSRLVRTAAVSVAALCLATAAAWQSPAAAQYLSWTDAAGDMWEVESNNPGPATNTTNADLRQVSIDHRAHNLVIKTSYTDILKAQYALRLIDAELRTNEGKTRWLQVSYFPGEPLFVSVQSPSAIMRCGQTAAVDWAANTVRLRVPRECLSHPKWVRVHLESANYNGGFNFDDAHSADAPDHRAFIYTRRIYRG